MHGFAHSLTPSSILRSNPFAFSSLKSSSSALVSRIRYVHSVEHFMCTAQFVLHSYRSEYHYYHKKSKKKIGILVRASGRDSPYDVLGVSPSASTKEIKRAYRRLALKYHPDVNKEAGAQENFMRIKHAYNALLTSKSRGKYDAANQGSDFSYSSTGNNQTKSREADEEFYGFTDFFRDVEEEFRNWDANASTQGKPKSLWEELAEIGEELVEFLEKELNITNSDGEVTQNNGESSSKGYASDAASANRKEAENGSNVDDNLDENLDEIEAALAKLKRELGL